eukprot:CAMPEP_0172439638 /NCGR_PEP_ID=MMETSP1065-20121228/554_1 /TAXON_ID=265537 /ORGANISM="Amphiprora paludosa, Strain CCMP125" /LENGTH=297 /DNA_ID=CAMNT_0013188347 /DNA_START=11 /DNA_END=904 /DNA_ORIENTATION=-
MTSNGSTDGSVPKPHHHHRHHQSKKVHEATSLLSNPDDDLRYDPFGEVPDARIGNPNAFHRMSERVTKSPKVPSSLSSQTQKRAITITLVTCAIAILVSCILWARWETSRVVIWARHSTQDVVEYALNTELGGADAIRSMPCDHVTIGVWLETCLSTSAGNDKEGMSLLLTAILPNGQFIHQPIDTPPDDLSWIEYGIMTWEPQTLASRTQNCQVDYTGHKVMDDASTTTTTQGSATVNAWNFHNDFTLFNPQTQVTCQAQRLDGKECRHYALQMSQALPNDKPEWDSFMAQARQLC